MVSMIILALVYTIGIMLIVGALVSVFGTIRKDTIEEDEAVEQSHKSSGEGMAAGSFAEGSTLESAEDSGVDGD